MWELVFVCLLCVFVYACIQLCICATVSIGVWVCLCACVCVGVAGGPVVKALDP